MTDSAFRSGGPGRRVTLLCAEALSQAGRRLCPAAIAAPQFYCVHMELLLGPELNNARRASQHTLGCCCTTTHNNINIKALALFEKETETRASSNSKEISRCHMSLQVFWTEVSQGGRRKDTESSQLRPQLGTGR